MNPAQKPIVRRRPNRKSEASSSEKSLQDRLLEVENKMKQLLGKIR
jgi:hypothetical protein